MSKTFPLPTVLAVVTGKGWPGVKFSQIHEMAEHVMGHPIWTHEFASPSLWERMRAAALRQHPDLADVDVEDLGPENADAAIERLIERLGKERTFERGDQARSKDPITTLREIAPHADVVTVVIGDKAGAR